ncbi:ATPase [Iodidimonas gelatinilytica]|uniref:histidine kinase n=1 Tax=Iodidimonas gelatinilytica TaxID=1236966 RepID=A0A5A7MP11_9PROT|nr:sensor histidine kinase [Iodidimonas gelatinilytica]GEQ97762.1 ATPase [Iodidimonas gelatinilytica]
MGRLTRSLTVRLLLSASLWLAVALAFGGFILAGAFRDYVVADFDHRLSLALEHMIGVSEVEDGLLRFTRPMADQRYSDPYSGLYWQVSTEDMPHFRSRSLWDQALDPQWEQPAFSQRVYETQGPTEQVLRIMVRDVVLPDDEAVYRYMVAGDTQQIRTDIDRFDMLILRSLGFLGLGLLLAVVAQVWIGLRPLKAVRTGLLRIRSGRAQRLEGRFPSEIQPLVEEMNALIAQNERVVERARTHVGNLAHALKTPLSVLTNEAKTQDGRLADVARAQAASMRQHIDQHLKRARAAGGGGVGAATALDEPVAELVRAMQKIYASRALTIKAELPPGLACRVDRQDLSEMVGNLLDNACKWAATTVIVKAERLKNTARPMLEICVEDDGPGITDGEAEAVFERGNRLDEAVPGSGLGLGIVRDIADMSGGHVRLSRSHMLGGVRAGLVLPAVET